MTKQVFLIGTFIVLSVLISACGTTALPAYEQDETSVAVARTETREALLTQGAIIPTDTPTVTPSPTVDFEATAAAEQATIDAQASIEAATAQAEADAQATTDAELAAEQATIDAQATLDAEAEAAAQPGADDPLFEAVANADAANGEQIFNAMAAPVCSTCHLVNTEDRLVGPGQLNLLARTIERIENGTIVADGPYSYIYNSIINPDEYIVEEYTPGVMLDVYEDTLTEDQIYDLIAYLASLSD